MLPFVLIIMHILNANKGLLFSQHLPELVLKYFHFFITIIMFIIINAVPPIYLGLTSLVTLKPQYLLLLSRQLLFFLGLFKFSKDSQKLL